MREKLIVWLYSLLSAVVSSIAGAILAVIVVPDKFQFSDLSTLGRVMLAFALVGAANYLLKSPLPNGKVFKNKE